MQRSPRGGVEGSPACSAGTVLRRQIPGSAQHLMSRTWELLRKPLAKEEALGLGAGGFSVRVW